MEMEKRSADFENSCSESSRQEVCDDGFHKEAANKKQKKQAVPLYKLIFSFADSIDILLMILGTAGALLNGATLPVLSILLGSLTDAFGGDPDVNRVIDRVAKVLVACFAYLNICKISVRAELLEDNWRKAGNKSKSIVLEGLTKPGNRILRYRNK